MRLEIVNIALILCFISKKTHSAEVLKADVPEQFIPISDHDYFYNDYDVNGPVEVIKPQPKARVKLSHIQKKKFYCQRFGSMFGIPMEKHKCGYITIKPDNGNKLYGILAKHINKRQLNSNIYDNNEFSQDYIDEFWGIGRDASSCTVNDFINNKCKLKSDDLKQLETNLFSNLKYDENYVDDLWRSCTIDDFINNKCVLKSDELKQLEKSQFPDSKSVKYKIKKSTSGNDFWRAKNVTGFSKDYVDDLFRIRSEEIDTPLCSKSDIINNKCNPSNDPNKLQTNRFSDLNLDKQRNEIPTSAKRFSLDYVGDSLRITSAKNNLLPCSVNDIINNGCNLDSDDLNLIKTRQFSDSNLHKEINEKPTPAKEFSQDDVVDLLRTTSTKIDRLPCSLNDIINNECNLNSDDLNQFRTSQVSGSNLNKEMDDNRTSAINFSQDYADDFWESERTRNNCCTIYEIINNKCEFNSKDLFCSSKYGRGGNSKVKTKKKSTAKCTENHKPLYSSDYMDFFEEEDYPKPISTGKRTFTKIFNKPKPKEISTLRRGNFIQHYHNNRPNQFRNKKRSRYSDADSSAEKSESEEKPKNKKPKRFQIVRNKKTKKERKKPKKQSSDSEIDSSEKAAKSSKESAEEISSVEKIKKKDAKYDSDVENEMDEIDTSDSFETGPKKPSERYEYLQGHRVVKPKAIKARRASRLQTFLPKRYHWKLEDIHNLGYYWFEGPKGAFPSENM